MRTYRHLASYTLSYSYNTYALTYGILQGRYSLYTLDKHEKDEHEKEHQIVK